MTELYKKHKGTLEKAIEVCRKRYSWSPFIDNPSAKIHGEEALKNGKAAFEAHLGRSFDLDQPGTIGRVGHEISPYTQAPLNIDYPKADVDQLFSAAKAALPAWRDAGPAARAGVIIEILTRLSQETFENAFATMHTAGQSFPMAFAGSGSNALDRGMEALAHAMIAQREVPENALWEKNFGKDTIRLQKDYRLMPRGVGLVICCATFPAWNAYPAMVASLATGNPVIVKPHPNGILPMAIAVRRFREILNDCGFDPNLVLLAADEISAPVTKQLIHHPGCAIVDFTGSARFGQWVEENSGRSLVYTETAGVNSVIVESAHDLTAVITSVARTLCLFSAQMCTSPQNIYIPAQGVRDGDRLVPYEEVVERLVAEVKSLSENIKIAPNLFGALQSDVSLKLLEDLEKRGAERGTILKAHHAYDHPDFPQARTATPLMIELDISDRDFYQEEVFAPVAFVIKAKNREQALAQATSDVQTHGAIASYFYSSDPDFLSSGQNAFAEAGASLTCNLTGNMPLNFAAAYSDYHVTGLNPAGNACLADLAFVADRFRIVQIRYPMS
ncbi:phenylacetic acid degradation protein PaaN [Paremcibacter congregatus]|uniref:Phenylacetic acid degradation protein PaaN n=1 Tax=Paremcibacter congregatus TaxID=2043170 RepID=A0A2G4YSV5_9PROT|nr:phenylacetic acid degradation protein PaaN [Paremcibacter congregatus]PHZ85405.1 phenylacetic acid degradation protein PaaN [Paremcibacter congregatus]QDE27661.1 phenylacetic acid degradation protein PaaN [Paremcibacter congregatus]